VRARAAPLVGRLQQRFAGRRQYRRRVLVDLAGKRFRQRLDGIRSGDGPLLAIGQRCDIEVDELLFPVRRTDREQSVEIHDDPGSPRLRRTSARPGRRSMRNPMTAW